MPILCLTDKTIRALKPPPEGQVIYFDTHLTGFAIRLSQGGARTFLCVHGRHRTKTTIGRYPILTLQQARRRAREVLAHAVLNPSCGPALSFAAALDRYRKHREPELKPSTFKDHMRYLGYFSWSGTLDGIATRDVARALDRIEKPSEKAHAHVAMKTFFNWCVARRYIDRSPLQGLPRPKPSTPRTRVLTDDELAAVWSAASKSDAYDLILRLLVVTAQRAGQIDSLREDWIDYQNRLIVFPAAAMKNNQEHILPFGPVAESLLKQAKPIGGYLFSPAEIVPRPFSNWAASKKRFDKRCNIAVHWTHHDLRRTWATNAARLDVQPHIIERVLSHITGTVSPVARIYNRWKYIEPMREAIEKVEGHVTQLRVREHSGQNQPKTAQLPPRG